MGTRALTYVYDREDSKPMVCMYRQMDGYPSGHGKDLADFMAGGKLVNGLGLNNTQVFNGMGCFAAALVAHFKDGPGGIYLHRPLLTLKVWQEYEYHISTPDDKQFHIIVKNDEREVLFDGNLEQFQQWCETTED